MSICFERGSFWVRFGAGGRGFAITDRRIHRPLFSCRNRIRCHHLGPFCFRILQPVRIEAQP